MQIIIKKGAKKEDVQKALAQMEAKGNKVNLAAFAGKLKDLYGDGLEYQKKLRNEWD